jgi:hypothetical protein
MKLAFLRVSRGVVSAGFGGLHLDTDIEVTHPRSATQRNDDVLRVLVNLHDAPRTLEIAGRTRDELGVESPRDRYAVLTLPADVPLRTVTIPPRTSASVFALTFWGSLIPHVGRTGDEGHFVASYGAYSHPASVAL